MTHIKTLLTTLLLTICCTTAMAEKYAFKGTINKTISFRLELQTNAFGAVAGETTYYRKNGKVAHLPVYGSIEKDGRDLLIFAHEYDGVDICGTFNLTIANGKLKEGKWNNDDKFLTISVTSYPPLSEVHDYLQPVTSPKDAEGEYGFSYSRGDGLDDGGGFCTIKANGKGITYEMSTVTPNIAELPERQATIVNSQVSGSYSNFRYKAYLDKNFVYVKRTNPDGGQVEDWGAHATVEGYYVKKHFRPLPVPMTEIQRAWNNTFDDVPLGCYLLHDIDGDGRDELFLANEQAYTGEMDSHGDCRAAYSVVNGKLHLIDCTAGVTGGASEYELYVNQDKAALVQYHINHGSYEYYATILNHGRVTDCYIEEVTMEWVGKGNNVRDTYTTKYYHEVNDKRTEVPAATVKPYIRKSALTPVSKLYYGWQEIKDPL